MSQILSQIEFRLMSGIETFLSRILSFIKIRSKKNWLILGVYSVFLIGFALFPQIRVQQSSLGKTVLYNSFHVPAYFILTLLFYNLYKSDAIDRMILLTRPVTFSAFSAFFVGILIELLQGIVNSRESSVIDVVLNSAGIMFFVMGITWLNEFRWVRKMDQEAPSLLTAYHSCFFQEFEVLQDKLRILKSENTENHKVILISSINPREGKTTVMLSLALALVQKEKRRVALVELNFSNPQLDQVFGMSSNIGALELFQGFESAKLAAQPTMLGSLDILTLGNKQLSRYQGFSSVAVREAIHQLRMIYDVVFIELTPFSVPVKNAISVRFLTSLADHVLLVIQKDATDRKKIREYLKLFEGYDSKILGTILNNRLKVA